MTQDEHNELKAGVEAVATQDVHLGRVLHGFLHHLAELAGLHHEPAAVEEAPAEEAAETPAEEAAEAPAEEPGE